MYCQDLDKLLDELLINGAVKLPSVIDATWRKDIYKGCLNEIGTKSYGENLPSNLSFIEKTNILSDLLPRLAKIAEIKFKKKVKLDDVYNVCRLVRPGDRTEGYRGHFDSHLFTLVTPINIPNIADVQNVGQLNYFPNLRQHPTTELKNIAEKFYYKKFNSESGFESLSLKKNRIVDDFRDYKPLLFLGNTTFHGNSPVDSASDENRMTILTHFFDPSSKFGIGNLMRMVRRR